MENKVVVFFKGVSERKWAWSESLPNMDKNLHYFLSSV